MCRLLPYCAAAARETGPRRPVSTPSIRCSELRLERLTPGKKPRRKGSPRSEGTSRHSYINYWRPYRTVGLQMSSTRCFRVSGPENGRRCRGGTCAGRSARRHQRCRTAGEWRRGLRADSERSVRRRRYPSGYLRPRRGDDPGGGLSAEYRAEPSPGNERPGGRDGALEVPDRFKLVPEGTPAGFGRATRSRAWTRATFATDLRCETQA